MVKLFADKNEKYEHWMPCEYTEEIKYYDEASLSELYDLATNIIGKVPEQWRRNARIRLKIVDGDFGGKILYATVAWAEKIAAEDQEAVNKMIISKVRQDIAVANITTEIKQRCKFGHAKIDAAIKHLDGRGMR